MLWTAHTNLHNYKVSLSECSRHFKSATRELAAWIWGWTTAAQTRILISCQVMGNIWIIPRPSPSVCARLSCARPLNKHYLLGGFPRANICTAPIGLIILFQATWQPWNKLYLTFLYGVTVNWLWAEIWIIFLFLFTYWTFFFMLSYKWCARLRNLPWMKEPEM